MPAIVHIKDGRVERPTETAEESMLPAEFANVPFVFVHYPLAWTFDVDRGFLPDLCMIQKLPGCNGVGKDGKLARPIGRAQEEKRGVVIRAEDARLGEWMNFVISYPCAGGGRHYCFKGTEFNSIGNGQAIPVPNPDGWAAFLAYLRDNQVVDPVSLPVFNLLMKRAEVRLGRQANRAAHQPHLNEKVEETRAYIEAMKTAWAACVAKSAAPVEPKRIRGARVETVTA